MDIMGLRRLTMPAAILGLFSALFSTAAMGSPTLLVVDATAVPGVGLVFTFGPRSPMVDEKRMIGGRESVVTSALLHLEEALPPYWMASVWRKGDIAPNDLERPLSSSEEEFTLSYGAKLAIKHTGDEWHIPTYDTDVFDIRIGFGVGSGGYVSWVYSVPCRPGQVVKMAPGGYFVVRSDGEDVRGGPVPDGDNWSVPSGSNSLLTFDSSGIGTLRSLP